MTNSAERRLCDLFALRCECDKHGLTQKLSSPHALSEFELKLEGCGECWELHDQQPTARFTGQGVIIIIMYT